MEGLEPSLPVWKTGALPVELRPQEKHGWGESNPPRSVLETVPAPSVSRRRKVAESVRRDAEALDGAS